MKYISRLTALLLALMMIVSNAGALTVNDLTQGTMDALYSAVSDEVEEMPIVGVLGEREPLTSTNAVTWAGEGYALQWYAVNAEGERTALIGETADALTVTYRLAEQRFVCVATDSNGNVHAETPVYVVAAQTNDMEEYLIFLYDYVGFYTDSGDVDAVAVYNFMNQYWNVAVEDSTLAANVVAAWWSEKDDSWFNNKLLCSCVVTEAAEADFCILHPYEAHVGTCGWYQDATVLQDEITGITVTGDIPAGVTLQVTAATGPMPEIDTSHVDITATSPMLRSHNITLVNEDGTKYIVPEGTTVRVNIPEVWSAWMTNPIVDVYHVTDDGEVVYLTSRKGEVILMDDHSICFETDGFSTYQVLVGTQTIGALSNGQSVDYEIAQGAILRVGEYWQANVGCETTAPGVVDVVYSDKYYSISVAENAPIGTNATVTIQFSEWDGTKTATVNVTVVEEKKPTDISSNDTHTIEAGIMHLYNAGNIMQFYMAPNTSLILDCFQGATVEVENWVGNGVSSAVVGNLTYVVVSGDAEVNDAAKVMITDSSTGAFKAVIYVDVIAEKVPQSTDNDPMVSVGSKVTSTHFADGSIARYKMAPDTTAIVPCGSSNLEAVSSMQDVVHGVIGADGKTLYVTVAGTATSDSTAVNPVKIVVRDKDSKVVKGIIYVDVIDEQKPTTVKDIPVGSHDAGDLSSQDMVRYFKMAPDTSVIVNCPTTDISDDTISMSLSAEGAVSYTRNGSKFYITTASTARAGDTAKLVVRDATNKAVQMVIFIDVIDEPDPATLSYTATHTVDLGDMDTGAFSNGAVLKYCIAPGMTASATAYGDVEVTVEDESIAAVTLTDDVFKVTADANAEIGKKTKIVVKDKTTKAVVTTIYVEIVAEYVPPTAKDKLAHDDYPVQLAIRNDGELPNEPWIYTSSPYTYFDRSVNEDGEVSHWIAGDTAEIGETADGIIATTIVDHEKFKLIYPDGADVIGLVDPTGEILLSFLSGINWDSLMDCVVARNEDSDGGNNITVADGTVVTSQNRDGYKIIPYVVKCQEDSGQGWHIDCAVVAKDAVLLSYDVNVPDGMIILTENVALPNNETGAAGSAFNVGKIVDSNTDAALTELTVEPDYKFTFLGWNTKEDGTGAMYQPDSSITITEDTTLYAIWSITPELGTGNLKVRKLVNDAAATGDEAFIFSISISNADEEEYDYVLYGADSIAVKDADGNVVSSKIKSGDTFTLTAGQYVIITGLPIAGKAEGAEAYTPNVTVTETTPGGYAPTWSGSTANGASVAIAIMDGRLSEVTCTNAKAAATGELKVAKDGLQNSNESAIVEVVITTDGESTTYTLVLNKATPSVVITNIPIGSTYTVTERTGWTWLYSDGPAYDEAAGTIGDEPTTCTITNHSYSDQWMHDESYLVNNFGTGSNAGVNE